jgi:hypothetical protein
VPDDFDYRDLHQLLAHPERWRPDELASAQFMLANQKRAIEDANPRDESARQSLQDVVDALAAAIERYIELDC